jgi:hypothetical protein
MMAWDLIVAAAFVVVSVAVLVCFAVKFIVSCLKEAQPLRCLLLSALYSRCRQGLKQMARQRFGQSQVRPTHSRRRRMST